MKPSYEAIDVEVLNEDVNHDGFLKLKTITLKHKHFDGSWSDTISRECLIRKSAASVLLLDIKQKSLVFVEQFRIGLAIGDRQASPWGLECVAGICEDGENFEDLILREAKEEAGCHIKTLRPIISYYPSPGGSSEKLHLYVGLVDSRNVAGIHGLKSEHEDIKAHVITIEKAYSLLDQGKINNAATIIALQWLRLNETHLSEVFRNG